MPIEFVCTCGKRLKARDEIAGRVVRCTNCNTAIRVPPAAPLTPLPPEADSPFEAAVDQGDAPTPQPPSADIQAVVDSATLDWLKQVTSEETLAPQRAGTISPATTPEPIFAELIETAGEPIKEARDHRTTPRTALPSAPRTTNEPWVYSMAAQTARWILLATLALSVLVPAFLLIGGLVALAQTGNPRSLGNLRLGGIFVVPALALAFTVGAVLSIIWAGPVLMIVDQYRRFRALHAKLDDLMKRLSRLAPHEPPE
jgi:hypothetical protein